MFLADVTFGNPKVMTLKNSAAERQDRDRFITRRVPSEHREGVVKEITSITRGGTRIAGPRNVHCISQSSFDLGNGCSIDFGVGFSAPVVGSEMKISVH